MVAGGRLYNQLVHVGAGGERRRFDLERAAGAGRYGRGWAGKDAFTEHIEHLNAHHGIFRSIERNGEG